MAAMKNCGNADDSTGTSVKVNAVRSGIILVVSVIVFAVSRAATADGVWIAALSGVSNALNMLSWLVCATAVSLCIVETFVMIGSVVFPLALSPLLYAGETVSATQWAGAGVILAAVVLFCVGRDVKFGKKGIVWIAVCTLSSAGCNVTAKLYAVRAGSEYVAFFNLVTFVIVFTFFAVVAAITVLKNRKKTDSAADSGPVEYSGRAADSGHAEEKDPQPREFFGLPKRTYFRIAIAAVGMYATNYFMERLRRARSRPACFIRSLTARDSSLPQLWIPYFSNKNSPFREPSPPSSPSPAQYLRRCSENIKSKKSLKSLKFC